MPRLRLHAVIGRHDKFVNPFRVMQVDDLLILLKYYNTVQALWASVFGASPLPNVLVIQC